MLLSFFNLFFAGGGLLCCVRGCVVLCCRVPAVRFLLLCFVSRLGGGIRRGSAVVGCLYPKGSGYSNPKGWSLKPAVLVSL